MQQQNAERLLGRGHQSRNIPDQSKLACRFPLARVIVHQGGQNDVTEDFITNAIDLKFNFAEVHKNLENASQDLANLHWRVL